MWERYTIENNIQWVSLKYHWKISTLYVQHHEWLSTLDNTPSNVFLQVAHSKFYQTWLYPIIFWLSQFLSYDSKIDYKWMFPLFYFHHLNDPDKSTIPKTATGMFFEEAIIFNNVNLETVAPSPKNNNPNISASFLITDKFLFMFYSWIKSSSYLNMIFLLGVIYVL